MSWRLLVEWKFLTWLILLYSRQIDFSQALGVKRWNLSRTSVRLLLEWSLVNWSGRYGVFRLRENHNFYGSFGASIFSLAFSWRVKALCKLWENDYRSHKLMVYAWSGDANLTQAASEDEILHVSQCRVVDEQECQSTHEISHHYNWYSPIRSESSHASAILSIGDKLALDVLGWDRAAVWRLVEVARLSAAELV